MEQKSLKNKALHPIDPEDLWFVCDKCGTSYNDSLEEIIPPEEIKNSIEWAYSPTSYENRMEALKKSEIRMKNELGYGLSDEDPQLGSCITGVWRQDEYKEC